MKNQISKLKKQKLISIIKDNSGQIVLLLVLITVVGLTIGLSLISRTVTDVRISSQIEQSGRAFSAAEAGVENALQSINSGAITPTGSLSINNLEAEANYSIKTYGGTSDVLVFNQTEANATQLIWLIDHDNARNIVIPTPPAVGPVSYDSAVDICWGSDPNTDPAVEVSLYYISGGEFRIAKAAYDSIVRVPQNNFYWPTDPGVNVCGSNYRYQKRVTFNSSAPDGFGIGSSAVPLALRLRPLYANSTLAIRPFGSFNLPKQGEIITSVGHTGTDTVRKIEVINGYKQMPSILDYALFCDNCMN